MLRKDQQSAKESYGEILSGTSRSYLVDVRSSKEWMKLGVPNFPDKPEKLILCEWRKHPHMEINENFFEDLSMKLDLKKVESLFFICAAGVRSQEAAIYTKKKSEEFGYSIHCINVFDGFNGNTANILSLGKVSGWRSSNLPICKLTKFANEH